MHLLKFAVVRPCSASAGRPAASAALLPPPQTAYGVSCSTLHIQRSPGPRTARLTRSPFAVLPAGCHQPGQCVCQRAHCGGAGRAGPLAAQASDAVRVGLIQARLLCVGSGQLNGPTSQAGISLFFMLGGDCMYSSNDIAYVSRFAIFTCLPAVEVICHNARYCHPPRLLLQCFSAHCGSQCDAVRSNSLFSTALLARQRPYPRSRSSGRSTPAVCCPSPPGRLPHAPLRRCTYCTKLTTRQGAPPLQSCQCCGPPRLAPPLAQCCRGPTHCCPAAPAGPSRRHPACHQQRSLPCQRLHLRSWAAELLAAAAGRGLREAGSQGTALPGASARWL
jgi:hypothetical protein